MISEKEISLSPVKSWRIGFFPLWNFEIHRLHHVLNWLYSLDSKMCFLLLFFEQLRFLLYFRWWVLSIFSSLKCKAYMVMSTKYIKSFLFLFFFFFFAFSLNNTFVDVYAHVLSSGFFTISFMHIMYVQNLSM